MRDVDITRKQFLRLVITASSAVAVGGLAGCSDDSDDGGKSGSSGSGGSGGGSGGSSGNGGSGGGAGASNGGSAGAANGGSAGAANGGSAGAANGGTGGGSNIQSCNATQITKNHDHALDLPVADLDSTDPKDYDITGTSDHPHTITLTPADFATLKSGGSVTVTSTNDDNHTHNVTIACK